MYLYVILTDRNISCSCLRERLISIKRMSFPELHGWALLPVEVLNTPPFTSAGWLGLNLKRRQQWEEGGRTENHFCTFCFFGSCSLAGPVFAGGRNSYWKFAVCPNECQSRLITQRNTSCHESLSWNRSRTPSSWPCLRAVISDVVCSWKEAESVPLFSKGASLTQSRCW